jgi:glycosyltransferase involved in cell wall biosynthesis
MACGVPVVSTNVGGPTETVVDGETGFWVPPRDAHAIAARVCELLTNRELRAQMGARGRQRVVEHFALTTSVARTEQVYRELLESQT